MHERLTRPLARGAVLLLGVLAAVAPAAGQTPKRGGILNSVLIEDPPGLLIHESATVSNVWPMSPCYSNLVLFDPLKPLETVDTVIPELAERWSWQDNYRNLVFFLRKNVKWHDGQALHVARRQATPSTSSARPPTPPRSSGSARARTGTRTSRRSRCPTPTP